jgi:hypothetical protein
MEQFNGSYYNGSSTYYVGPSGGDAVFGPAPVGKPGLGQIQITNIAWLAFRGAILFGAYKMFFGKKKKRK